MTPGASGEQHQNGEDLQTAGQHIQRQNDLAENGKAGKIAGGANGGKAGADVIEAGQHSRQPGVHAADKGVYGNKQEADDDADHIGSGVGIGVVQHGLADGAAAHAHRLHLLGVDEDELRKEFLIEDENGDIIEDEFDSFEEEVYEDESYDDFDNN